MMLWILIIIALVVQETFTTNSVLAHALSNNYPLGVIHLIFVLATIFDISFGYFIGRSVQKLAVRFRRVSNWSASIRQWVDRVLGYNVERYGLFAFGTIAQPYITAFVGSWLAMNFMDVFLIAFIADIIWYCCSLAIVLGVSAIVPAKYVVTSVI